MTRLKSPLLWFLVAVLATAALTAIGPQEKTLGESVRIVYLHGAWVLTAEITLALAALAGLLAILFRRDGLHRWSAALGRTGMFFWVTYLPLSLWAMQANWNGLFLSEPRFRLAVIFAVTGVLLQVGLTLITRPFLTSLLNVLFFAALEISLRSANYVMHPPPSPIFNSGIFSLQFYFIGVVLLALVAAYFMTRWWLKKQPLEKTSQKT
jgi:hypothetical protein